MDIGILIAEVNSVEHLNILFLFGIAALAGTVGARVFQRFRIPQVVGSIAIGVVIGCSGLNFINTEAVRAFTPFNIFALGIIGFMIGGELKYKTFKKYGKQFSIILFSESFGSFIIVTIFVFFAHYLFTHNVAVSLGLGLMLGALSAATAPAATVDVLWEYKTKGILARTVLAIVALDDGLALLIYGFASSITGALLSAGCGGSVVSNILTPVWEISGALVLGFSAGIGLIWALKYIRSSDKLLVLSIALVLLVMGLSKIIGVESILAAMVFGATVSNLKPRLSKSIFNAVEKFSPPIYVLFFVFVGARLEIHYLSGFILFIAAVYLVCRSFGKISGSWFGARISKAPMCVRKYLGLCLFSQAGVAIGLALLASERFSDTIGGTILMVVTVTTLVVQLIGPSMVKLAVTKAGEVGLNITEDDLIETYKVEDVMDSEPAIISSGSSLQEVIGVVSRTEKFYYPVLDEDKLLVGVITLDGIRKTFSTQEINQWLVALDIMEPAGKTITADTPLSEAFEQARRFGMEHLAVTEGVVEGKKFLGVLDCKAVHRSLSAEVLERQRKAESG